MLLTSTIILSSIVSIIMFTLLNIISYFFAKKFINKKEKNIINLQTEQSEILEKLKITIESATKPPASEK